MDVDQIMRKQAELIETPLILFKKPKSEYI